MYRLLRRRGVVLSLLVAVAMVASALVPLSSAPASTERALGAEPVSGSTLPVLPANTTSDGPHPGTLDIYEVAPVEPRPKTHRSPMIR